MFPVGIETAIEHDEDQGNRTDHLSLFEIFIFDLHQAVRTKQHADKHEKDQSRNADLI